MHELQWHLFPFQGQRKKRADQSVQRQTGCEGVLFRVTAPRGCTEVPKPGWDLPGQRGCDSHTAARVAMETAEPLHQDPGDQAALLQPENLLLRAQLPRCYRRYKNHAMCWFTQRAIDNAYTSLNTVFFFFEISPFRGAGVTVKLCGIHYAS